VPQPPGAGANWVRLAADTAVLRGPLNLSAAILTDDASGTNVFYEGVNTSGRRLFSIMTIAGVVHTVPVYFSEAIYLERGLYVDVAATIDDLLVAV